jgi:hypothetical protein
MWTFLAEIASPIEKVRLTLAARRYARHLGSQLRRGYGGGDEYTAAQIRVAVQKCRLPVRYITLGYAAFMAEEAFRAIADKRDWPEYMSLRALYFEWVSGELVFKTGKSAAESLNRSGGQPVAVVSRAETRTYAIVTWQKPGDQTIIPRFALTYRDVIVKSDDGRWLFKERKRID